MDREKIEAAFAKGGKGMSEAQSARMFPAPSETERKAAAEDQKAAKRKRKTEDDDK